MRIKNTSKGKFLAENCKVADTFRTRLRGLIGKSGLQTGDALFIKPCNSVHTLFMRFPIDVLFLDANNTVIFLIENMLPWKISPFVKKAKSVVEIPVGTIKASNTETGDSLEIN